MTIDQRMLQLFALSRAAGVKPLTFSQASSLTKNQFDPNETFNDLFQEPLADIYDTGSLYDQLKVSADGEYSDQLDQVGQMRQRAMIHLADLRRRLNSGEDPSQIMSEWTNAAPKLSAIEGDQGIGPEAVDVITRGLSDYGAAAEAAQSAPIENMVNYLIGKGVDPTPALENARRMSDYQAQVQRAAAIREAYGPVVDNPMWDSYNRHRR